MINGSDRTDIGLDQVMKSEKEKIKPKLEMEMEVEK